MHALRKSDVNAIISMGSGLNRGKGRTMSLYYEVRKANKGSLGHIADLHVGMDWHDQRLVPYLLFSGRSTTDVFGGQLKPMANGPLALQCHAKWH